MLDKLDLNPESIKRRTIKALKAMFGSRIKQNFLIEIWDRTMINLVPDVFKYFEIEINDEKMVSGSTDSVDYEVCKNIVGIHRSNLIFLSDSERAKLEADEEYKKKLVKDVINQIKFRGLAGKYFRKFPIVRGDEFIYFPLPYFEFVTCLYSETLLHQNNGCNCFSLYSTLFNKSLSALSLLEDNFLDNCYPICRGIIELFLKLVCFHDNKSLMEEYNKFVEFEVDKECCGNHRKKEFEIIFENRIDKRSKIINEYLHYGWVDKIPDYHKIIKSHPYTFGSFLEYLRNIAKDDSFKRTLESLKYFYKMCNAFTHGNIGLTKYPLLHYFEISLILGIVLQPTFDFLICDLNANPTVGEINISDKLVIEINKVNEQYNKRSTNKFESYYKSMFN